MTFYTFGLPSSKDVDFGEATKNVLGGKGAGLLWMSKNDVPVPPGFVIPVSVWADYVAKPKSTMKLIAKELPKYLALLREHLGHMPLLSVRSGSRVSCPGMMDTILNVGIDDTTQALWLKKLGPECYGNSLHRLLTMYGSVVKGLDRAELAKSPTDALKTYYTETGEDFPDAEGQLLGAIEAVFKSWENDRAKVYREMNSIPHAWGTAVTIQAMVFGNLNENSGTGVLFTRNPDTGENFVTGEYVRNAQGEDIVAGIKTPSPLVDMSKDLGSDVYNELMTVVKRLEKTLGDVQDIEFTVQDGKLFILQTRNAKRSATAALKVALDMVTEGLITPKVATTRVTAKQFDLAQTATLASSFTAKPNLTGIGASSGIVKGKPVFSKAEAIKSKEPCILITHETTPDDIAGMKAAVGVITMVGGLTSHAAVVARGMDKPCIVGLGVETLSFTSSKVVTMDGKTGRVWLTDAPILAGGANALTDAYSALLCETLGVTPVIISTPLKPLNKALLYLGANVMDTVKAVELIQTSLDKVDTLYVDFTVSENGAEADYFSLFGDYNPAQQVLKLLVEVTLNPTVMATMKKKLVVIGKNVVHPFKTVGMGGDLRSLVLAEAEMTADTFDLNDPAIVKVLEWKKANGLPALVSIGKWVADRHSLLSVSQLLHLNGA